MVDLTRKFDVLVIGGGNAALCAAISARRAGASVLVLEGAPKFYRGGNTRHTRNMRCAHDAATDILTGPYTEEEFWDDLLRLTGGQTDEELAKFMIAESKDILNWIVAAWCARSGAAGWARSIWPSAPTASSGGVSPSN